MFCRIQKKNKKFLEELFAYDSFTNFSIVVCVCVCVFVAAVTFCRAVA
jgi:hypothetical protein